MTRPEGPAAGAGEGAVWSLAAAKAAGIWTAGSADGGRAAPGRWRRVYETAVGGLVVAACLGGALAEVRGRVLAARPSGAGPPADPAAVLAAALTIVTLALVCAFAAGGWRGPVMGDPFAVMVTMAADPDGRAALRRFRRPALVVAAAAPVIWLALAFATGTGLTWAAAATGAAFAACGGALAGVVWLAGQVWPKAARLTALAALGAAMAGVIAARLAGPQAVSWSDAFALGSPDTFPAAVWLLAGGGVLAGGAWLAAPHLARRLDPRAVLDQALAWEAAGVAALSGEANQALAAYRAAPGRPRAQALPRRGSWAWAFIRSDAVTLIRSPGRGAAALAGLSLAGWWLATALLNPAGWAGAG
ncbi:MAG: hypothetical protein LBO20_03880, partial [Bifidobacteriaceae bacterium]|nr:hypothetical protein [Bifidobacteriaceae bacterium]